MNRKKLLLICFLSVPVSFVEAQTNQPKPAKAFLDAATMLKAWEDNYAHFNSMQVSYTERVLEAKPAADPNIYDNLVKITHVERVEQGNRFHVRYSTAEDGFAQPDTIIEGAFDGEITREYFASNKHGMIIRGMIGRNTEMMNSLKTYMLLHRRLLQKENDSSPFEIYWIEDPNSKAKLSSVLDSAISRSAVSVLPELESVAGQLCHVLDINYRGRTVYKMWLAHEKGMLPLKYQRHEENKDFKFESEIEVEQIGCIKTDKGNIWYPRKAYRTSNIQSRGKIKYELKVHQFLPNVKVDEKTFRFDFPKGTRVFDRIRNIAGVDLPDEPPSLVGKVLPGLKSLSPEIDSRQCTDKMILICFLDICQRPSRNFVRQLNMQVEQLRQKGVSILVIQAAQVDKDTFKELVEKSNITFPIRAIEGNAQTTRFNWGVRSLPWLILADRKHIIFAEGFSLNGLDDRIEEFDKKVDNEQ